MTYHQRKRALLRLAIVAFVGAAVFSWLFYYSLHASTALLVRLYHDQDASGTVSAGDIPAAGVDVSVTEATCTGQICAASTTAYIVTTDSDGYVSLALDAGEYEIAAPCKVATVQAADVSGQAATEWATCAKGLWLPQVQR